METSKANLSNLPNKYETSMRLDPITPTGELIGAPEAVKADFFAGLSDFSLGVLLVFLIVAAFDLGRWWGKDKRQRTLNEFGHSMIRIACMGVLTMAIHVVVQYN